jgi:hypothetical protein
MGRTIFMVKYCQKYVDSNKLMLITCYDQAKKRNHYDSMGFWVDEAQALMP